MSRIRISKELEAWCDGLVTRFRVETPRDFIPRIAALEAKLEAMEHQRNLYAELAAFKDAKYIALSGDFTLAAYALRDLQLTKEAGLEDLVWSMHKSGYVAKGDWELLRDQWLTAWQKARAVAQEEGE